MITVVIGAADQSVAYELQAALAEMDGIEVQFVVDSTPELAAAVLRLDPDVVLVHDQLGPEPALQTVRDLSLRRPACAQLLVTGSADTNQFSMAMDAGARGVVAFPPAYEDLRVRIAAAGEWAHQMRRILAAPAEGGGMPGGPGRARVISFTGSKGGVGTTTVATHLALDVLRNLPGHRVCLVDLDLEKGDVSGILEVRHRTSVADVAKVSQDLSAQAVGDAVVLHESGLGLLLAPVDVRDIEAVDPQSLREVFAVLRHQYDLIVVDAGSHVTPAQAAAVELADEVVMLVTPDVLALRGLRRTITQWENLGVRKESDVHVLVNRVSRQSSVSIETIRQLTRAPILSAGLPAMFRRLEPVINSRAPLELRDDVWWRALRVVGQEVQVVPGGGTAETPPRRDGRRRSRRRGEDAGQATLEVVGILPALLVVLVVLWQLALVGMTAIWSGHAASAAARAVSVGQDPTAAALGEMPGSMAGDLSVHTSGDAVTVSLRVPVAAPGLASFPGGIETTRTVVMEP
ncbi:AAA family ATPase [Kineosporia sp. J2-2]|uniref:AAA family ATPase n=1 Tax=Kineosporia corallincola TaxID=2835133 RepID=A0ABS5TNQ7_9ACTN|nr:AAA family ATPase [Kineosporia corallincola]MBT0772630.1 AAA family ATPase [Kineosporia corallincola]